MKKWHTLSAKLAIGFTVFAVILLLCVGSTVGYRYWNTKTEEYRALAYSYTRTAAQYIDGDRVLGYLDTLEQDAYYQQVMDFLTAARDQSGLRYYYVFVPYEDDLVYVWDAGTVQEGACPLGTHEDYMEGGKKAVADIFRPDPPETISVERDAVYGYIASAYSPIFDSGGQPVAVVGVDLSMAGIQRSLWQFILTVAASISIISIAALAAFYTFIRRKVVRPIAQLNRAAKDMVSNLEREESAGINIRTGDEIQELGGSFVQMDREVRDYIKRLSAVTAEKERIGAELNVATQIQADMLPNIFPAFPERPEFDIYATMEPAKEVGGDFYDFFLVDSDHLALVMADVSGKGVPAALFMVIAKTLLKNAAQMGLSPKDVLEKVNNQLCENNEAEMFVTVWLGILEISTGHLTCANAGHEYPALRRAGGSYELVKDKHGFVLAGMENTRYREYELELKPGDELYVYTDGVAEATDSQNELFGTDRMLEALNRRLGDGPDALLPGVKAEIDRFVGETPQFDDITMLGLRYLGPAGQKEESA